MRTLSLPEKFGNGITSCLPPDDIMDEMRCLCRDLFHIDKWTISFEAGSTKLVVLMKDYVYKFPYNGTFLKKNDQSTDENSDTLKFRYFTTDYCETEYDMQQEIPETLKMFFATVDRITKCGVTYYKQIACRPSAWTDHDTENELPHVSDSIRQRSDYEFDDYWLSRAEELYGERKVIEFLEWLSNESGITDLHDENFGYTDDGNWLPVIIDWGGFYG